MKNYQHYWRRLSQIGTQTHYSERENFNFTISNQLSFAMVAVLSIYPFVYLALGLTPLAILTGLGIVLNAAVLGLNTLTSLPLTGRMAFLAFNNFLLIAYCLLLGRETLAHLFFLCLSVAPMLVFQRHAPSRIVLWSLVPFALFLFMEFYGFKHFQFLVLLNQEQQNHVYHLIIPSLFLITFMFTGYFYSNSNRYETILLGKIEDLNASQQLVNQQQFKLATASHFSALGELSGSIAHEINNPLAIIKGYATQLDKLMVRQHENAERIQFINSRILQTVERISRIVTGLQKLSREGNDDAFEEVDLLSILKEVDELSHETLSFHGITMVLSIENEKALCYCRPVQILQVLLNLIHNAKDAIADLTDKWIHLELRKNVDCWEITVTDSGPGLSPEVLARINQPFFTTKPPGKGTGLGLSISRRILAAHSGSLHIGENSNHTSFLVRLPQH